MRRLHAGLLAAALLLAAGCGSGERADDATAVPDAIEIRTPALAVTTRALATARSPETSSTVLVTSPDGVSSPGLDAVVAALLERPDLDVVVVTPGAADGGGETMSGFPAHVVAAPAAEVVAVAVEELGIEPDLVLVGIVEGAVLGSGIDGSASVVVARAAATHGIPALAITAGTEHGADHAAATMILRSLLDLELESLVAPGARLLTVPSCDGGTVRAPVEIGASALASAPTTVECGGAGPMGPTDDVEAHAGGYATLVPLTP